MTGPLYEINRALQDMLYQPDRDYNTHGTLPDVITLTLDDVNGIGLKGTGEHHHVVSKLSMNVSPTNDPPIVHVPGDHRTYTYDGLYNVTSVDVIEIQEDGTFNIE